MIYFLLFVIELFLVFLFSRSLTHSLAKLFYCVSKSKRFTFNVLAIIFLPGTIVHEMAHFLSAGMMGVHVGEIDVLPSIEDDGVRFGMVKVNQTDIFRQSVIGIAPVILGLGVIFTIFWLFQTGTLTFNALWQEILIIYIIFSITNTMFSSKKDMEEATGFFVAIFLILAICLIGLLYTNFISSSSLLEIFNSEQLINFFQKIDLFLLILIGIDFFILSLTKILNLKST